VGSVRATATPSSVGAVRSELRHDLAVLPAPVREDAELVLTELLGNAMRHGRSLRDGGLAVSWAVGEVGVEIAVTDGGGPTLPIVVDAGPTEIGGRGLSIVSMLAASWGVDRHDAETTVWAVVPVRARSLSHV
jgi:serine/threonine-protein kinase RsbW